MAVSYASASRDINLELKLHSELSMEFFMLIAVTSSDGINIDTHFGKADRFLVYETAPGEPKLMYEVRAPSYCEGAAPGHTLMPDKLAAIAAALGGCRVVVTAMVGDAPRAEMERLGIDLVVLSAPVSAALKEVMKLY